MSDITPRQETAFELRSRCIYLRKKMSELFLEFGWTLKKIRDEKLYLQMGEGGYDTFYQFLADPEINLNPNTAHAYIRVYEFYVEKLKLSREEIIGIPFNRLNQITNYLKDKNEDEVKEWIEKARHLGRKDFEEELHEHKIAKKPKIKIEKCKQCGGYKVYYEVDVLCTCTTNPFYGIPVEIDENASKE